MNKHVDPMILENTKNLNVVTLASFITEQERIALKNMLNCTDEQIVPILQSDELFGQCYLEPRSFQPNDKRVVFTIKALAFIFDALKDARLVVVNETAENNMPELCQLIYSSNIDVIHLEDIMNHSKRTHGYCINIGVVKDNESLEN